MQHAASEMARPSHRPPCLACRRPPGSCSLLFVTGILVQQHYRRDRYDPVSQFISDSRPVGVWIQQVNFILFGCDRVCVGAAAQRPPGTRAGLMGPGYSCLTEWGLTMRGIFPLREDATGVV